MLNLNRQSAAQILLIDDREVRRFVWEHGILGFDRSYPRDEAGLAEYRSDLPLFDPLPVLIITDFIEESFRNESIAHVNPYDRSAILKRRLDYTYRHTPFRSARLTGRETQGRRDDTVLLSALTKPSLVQAWIDPLLANGLHIQCITSTAYLLEDFVQHSGRSSIDNLLIVSIDRGLKLRQTFLSKGHVLFSRSTLLSGNDNATMSHDIHTESQRIRRYLERIRLLKSESPLQVHIFSLRDEAALTFSPAPHDHIHPRVINSAALIPPEQVSLGHHKPGSIILFLLETLRKQSIANVYAPFAVRRYYHLRNIARACIAASCLIIAGTLLLKLPALFDIVDDRQQLAAFQTQARPVNERYRALQEELPDMPVPPREMGLIVTRAEQLRASASSSGAVLTSVSEALSGTDQLRLTSLEWHAAPPQRDEAALIARYGVLPNTGEDPATAVQRAALDGTLSIEVQISGVAGASGSYRAAQNRVLSFINGLENASGGNVTPLQLPTDARSDTRVTTTVNDREVNAPFSLRLTMEAASP